MPGTIRCEVLTPYRRFFTDNVFSLTFVTHNGDYEVLAEHEPSVVPIRIGRLRLKTAEGFKSAFVSKGFALIKRNQARVFVMAAEWPEDIDRERAQEALKRAEKRLEEGSLKWSIEQTKFAKARAKVRLRISDEVLAIKKEF